MPDTIKRTTGTKVAFGDVVQLSKERSKDPEADGFERYIGLEHLEPSDLKIRSWGDLADGVTFTNVFRPGQVLFGKRRAYQRKVAVADFSGVCSGDIYVLEPKGEQLRPELLPFICQSEPFYDYVISMSQGGLSPRVNWKALAKYEFALPPLEEQRRIVRVLQAVERSRDQNHQFGAKLEVARLAWLDAQTKHFVKNFPEQKLEEVCEQITDGAHFTPTYVESGVPFLRVTDIQSEKIDWNNVKRIPMEEHKELCRRCSPTVGDVLLSKNGTIGITKIVDWEEEFSIFVSLCLLKPSSKIEPAYLKSMIEAPHAARQLLLRIKQGTVKNLHLEEIRECQIPIPDTKTQLFFVDELGKFTSAQRHLIERNEALSQISGNVLRQLEDSKTA